MCNTGSQDKNMFDIFTTSTKEVVESSDKFAVFDNWLLENGTAIPKLELKDYGNEVRGCHTNEEIDDDEIIIEVPLKCLITVEMGKNTEIGRAIIVSNIELDAPKHIFLMIFMLVDRQDPNSFFKPYYDILPATLSNMPIFWSEEELQFLEGSHLLEQIEERNEAIKADYVAICNVAPDFAQIASLLDFKWARMCVCSRNFGLVINGLQTAALVPYADMLNHYRPRETKWQFDDTLQSFTVISLQAIHAGAQVYDSYGHKCNHRFLLNYGFSVENNVEVDGFCPNEVLVRVTLEKTDPLCLDKIKYFVKEARSVRVCVSNNDNTKLFLALLRISAADSVDLNSLQSSSLYPTVRDACVAISVDNEMRTMTKLCQLCDMYLGLYPSSYEEDCVRLQYGEVPAFSNERHALIQVRGEKEVLLFFRDFALVALRLLQYSEGQQNVSFDTLLEEVRVTKDAIIYQYCRGTVSRLLQDNVRKFHMDNSTVNMPLDGDNMRSLQTLMRIIQQTGLIE